MVHTLEAIRGGEGSIRVGTTGTISALVTHELDSQKSTPASCKRRPETAPVEVYCGVPTKRLQSKRTTPYKKSTHRNTSSINRRRQGSLQKKLHNTQHTAAHCVPMLSSEDVSTDRTPNRDKTTKKGHRMVEIVDLKCGNPDKAWSRPITNQFKKLGFSRLSN